MTPYRRGDIILVPFPFTDFKSHKVRPAIIVSPRISKRGDAIVAFISSVLPFDKPEESAVVLETSDSSFAKTGLKVSSIFRMDKLITLHFSLILRHLGHAPVPLQRKITDFAHAQQHHPDKVKAMTPADQAKMIQHIQEVYSQKAGTASVR